jgi:hypothetical protein
VASERHIQHAVREAIGSLNGCAFFRNNVGAADTEDRHIRYGLAEGSSDLVGLVLMDSGAGRFCALEVKTASGRVSPAQKQWGELVRRYGGFYAVVRSVEEAVAAVARCRTGAKE